MYIAYRLVRNIDQSVIGRAAASVDINCSRDPGCGRVEGQSGRKAAYVVHKIVAVSIVVNSSVNIRAVAGAAGLIVCRVDTKSGHCLDIKTRRDGGRSVRRVDGDRPEIGASIKIDGALEGCGTVVDLRQVEIAGRP